MYNSVYNSVDNYIDVKGSLMTKKILLLTCASVLSLVILSACSRDDGQVWEAVEYDGGVYDDDRTAGRGVRYVLKALAPKKGTILKPILPATKTFEPLVALRISRRIDLGPMTYPLPERATPIGIPNPPPIEMDIQKLVEPENKAPETLVVEPLTGEMTESEKDLVKRMLDVPAVAPTIEPVVEPVVKVPSVPKMNDPKTLPEPKVKNASPIFSHAMEKSK